MALIPDFDPSGRIEITTDLAAPLLALPQPTLAPRAVTSAPSAGQGLALDLRGQVPASAASRWRVLDADPADPLEGEYWLRSDLNQLRWREGGVTYQVTGTAI